jgi:sugar phosphate permease
MWSLTKSQLKNYIKVFTSTEVSWIDFSELACYSVALFLSGIYGAHSNLKRNLVLALLFFCVTALAVALPGQFSSYYLVIFIIIKGLVGITNAFIWPTIMTALALWFPKKGRGIIVGFWATCNNLGHIGGA